MGVALILVAHAAFPAIQYEFIQTSRSDADTTDFTARATVDGARSKVEFLSGNAYPPGTYVISTDNARKLLFVDPTQKSYTELNTMSVASAIGTSNIKIDNFKPTVTKLDDQALIAGIAADHYRLTMTYDITVNFKAMPVKQSVYAVIDKWTTVQFGDAGEAIASFNDIQTGNSQIDELIAAETTKIRGFPLKQTIQITTTNLSRRSKAAQTSQLKIPVTRTRTREFTIMKISEVPAQESSFLVPAGFRKLNFAEQAPKSQMQVLSLEPKSE
jgi:hypothetical protein